MGVLCRATFKKITLYFSDIKEKIIRLYKKAESYQAFQPKDKGFFDLAPIEDPENNATYIQSLDWALGNARIRNIGLMGPYGSGKSSILKSYQKARPHLNFLNLSLANFRADLINKEKNEEAIATETASEYVERRFLQQLFYKLQAEKLPYSRYRKVSNIKIRPVFYQFLWIISLLSLGFILIWTNNWLKFIDILAEGFENLNDFFPVPFIIAGYITLLVLFLTSGVMVIRFITRVLRTSKINLDSRSGIKVSSDDECFTFNKYLDEILYFFEVSSYEVVIIEDIDRFEDINILMKIRELNNLLNNSEQINRRIVFVYALKDDVFEDETSRIKFFDYIIPVMPIISSLNSGEKLWGKLVDYELTNDLDEDFIKDVSLYIPDMRLLNNVFNEYKVYRALLKVNKYKFLKPQNLFALIVYKNCYPRDFANLQYERGKVHGVFNSKQKNLQLLVSEQEDEIGRLKHRLKTAESDIAKSEQEIIQLYWQEIMGIGSAYRMIGISNHKYSLSDAINDNFNIFDVTGTVYIYESPNRNSSRKEINEELRESYLERYKSVLLRSSEAKEEINNQIRTFQEEITTIQGHTLTEAIQKYGIEKFLSKREDGDELLVFLLRNGYLNETYPNYMNYFYEGSLNVSDMRFLMSVKDQVSINDYSYQLTNMDKLIERINIMEFAKQQILNFDLLNYLLAEQDKYPKKLEVLMSQLGNETEVSFKFVDQYLPGKSESCFFSLLCVSWPGIWDYIHTDKTLADSRKSYYLVNVLKNASPDDLDAISKSGRLGHWINDLPNFLDLFSSEYTKQINGIIRDLEVKFSNIVITSKSNLDVLDYVIEHDNYALNAHMVELISAFKLGVDFNKESFQVAPITTIQDVKNLQKRVWDNLEQYIKSVYLKPDIIYKEDEEVIVEILNSDLDINIKEKFLVKQRRKITDLATVTDKIWEFALKENRVLASWTNILEAFGEGGKITPPMYEFINRKENLSLLSRESIRSQNEVDEEELQNLWNALIRCDELSKESFVLLCKNFSDVEFTFEGNEMSEEHVRELIRSNLIPFDTDSYNNLRKYHDSLLHMFIKSNLANFLENIEAYDLDKEQLMVVLGFEKIKKEDRAYILRSKLDRVENLESVDVDLVLELILDAGLEFNVPKEIVISLLNSASALEYKVRLVTLEASLGKKEEVIEYLEILGDPYDRLVTPRSRPRLENNKTNLELLKVLKKQEIISSFQEGKNSIYANAYAKAIVVS